MKKVVLKLNLHDDKAKKKAMMKVSSLTGVESISMDQNDKKLTVIGDIDPVHVVSKLRKHCETEIVSVGPAKEEEKKKQEPKKEEPKKEEKKKDDISELIKAYESFKPNVPPYYVISAEPAYYQYPYYARPVVEHPSSCVIC